MSFLYNKNKNTNSNALSTLTNYLTNNNRIHNAQARRRRLTRYRNAINPMRLHIGRQTSSLGSEFRYALLTGFIEENCSNIQQFNIAQVFSTTESTSVFRNWLYVKLISVSVTYEPNNLNTSSRPLYMSLIWTNEFPTQLSSMNNVKIVPAYRVGFKTYNFRVPAIESSSLLLNKWKSPGDLTNSEFYLYLHSPGNTDTWNIRVDVKVKCKGSKIYVAGTRMRPKPEWIVTEEKSETLNRSNSI